jgi:hypothetical protein
MILRLDALVCDGAFEVDVKIVEEALAGVYQMGVMQLSKFYYCFSASSERWAKTSLQPLCFCAFRAAVPREAANGDG